ncbi:MAG: phosphatase PAP2 family protein [Bacilli bacterium]
MTDIMTLSAIGTFDYSLAKFAHDLANLAGDFLTTLLRIITLMGNGGLIFIILALLLLLFKKSRQGALIALIAMAIGFLMTNVILKYAFARPRPFMDTTSDYYTWWQAAGALTQDGFSFPSGHATVAMTFAFPLFLTFKKKLSWLFLFIPLIMGFTRIYFQVHFASDVIGGFVVGALCGVGAFYIYRALIKLKFMTAFLELPSVVELFKKNHNIEEKNKD